MNVDLSTPVYKDIYKNLDTDCDKATRDIDISHPSVAPLAGYTSAFSFYVNEVGKIIMYYRRSALKDDIYTIVFYPTRGNDVYGSTIESADAEKIYNSLEIYTRLPDTFIAQGFCSVNFGRLPEEVYHNTVTAPILKFFSGMFMITLSVQSGRVHPGRAIRIQVKLNMLKQHKADIEKEIESFESKLDHLQH